MVIIIVLTRAVVLTVLSRTPVFTAISPTAVLAPITRTQEHQRLGDDHIDLSTQRLLDLQIPTNKLTYPGLLSRQTNPEGALTDLERWETHFQNRYGPSTWRDAPAKTLSRGCRAV